MTRGFLNEDGAVPAHRPAQILRFDQPAHPTKPVAQLSGRTSLVAAAAARSVGAIRAWRDGSNEITGYVVARVKNWWLTRTDRRRDAARLGVVMTLVGTILGSSAGFVAESRLVERQWLAQGEAAQAEGRIELSRMNRVIETRLDATESAQVTVELAVQLQASAAATGVSVEQLENLETATAEVEELISQVLAAPVVVAEPETAEPNAADDESVVDTEAVTSDTAVDSPAASSATETPAPVVVDVTTPEELPDPVADEAGILDVAPTAVDQVRESEPAPDADEMVAQLWGAVEDLAVSAAQVSAAVEATRVNAELTAAATQAAAVAAAQADAIEQAWLQARAARLERDAHSLDGYRNGRIPENLLCSPAFSLSSHLRCDAAEMLDALNQAFAAEFGNGLVVVDSYRSYERQVACLASKGDLCAEPGTSKHGLGIAVDLTGAAARSGTAEHDWLLEHGPEFGWVKPAWSLDSGSKPEAWHFEFDGTPTP